MDFYTLLCLDLRPAVLKLFLHVAPHRPRLVIELVHFHLCGLFELVESKFALNHHRLGHEEFELSKGRVGLVTAPGRLNLDCRQDGSVGTFVLKPGVPDRIFDLQFVRYAGEDVLLRVLLVVKVRQLQQAQDIDVDVVDLVLGNELFNLLHQLGDDTPLRDVLSLELSVFRRLLVEFATFHDELGVGRHVLRLTLLLLHSLKLVSLFLRHAFLLEFEGLVGLRE